MHRHIIVDAHQDIAWNRIALGRSFFESAVQKRLREGPNPAHGKGTAVTGFPELLAANVRLVFGTLYVAPRGTSRTPLGKTYSTPEEAHSLATEQLQYYSTLASNPGVSLVRTSIEVDDVLDSAAPHVGLVILMEGADPIVIPDQVEEWYNMGVRVIGPAWGQTRYSGGTGAPGPLTELGYALLAQMERLGMILDVSHVADEAFSDAMETFGGAVVASHANCRTLVDGDRQLSDRMIRQIVARNGVIGVTFYNGFIRARWDGGRMGKVVSLSDVVDHVDHICDVAGDAAHVGIGTDFDGGFGRESIPSEIDTAADLCRLEDFLSSAGYSDHQIVQVLSENWISLLRRTLPDESVGDEGQLVTGD